jgi:alpha-ketoglutarate-dependent taurine dioxygenase
MGRLVFRDLLEGFGSEVSGVVPGAVLDEGERGLLRETFDERGLLVFRGLDIGRDYQEYLVDGLIGWERPPGPRRQTMVSNREQGGLAPYGALLFHSDMMWAPDPFQVLSLYAVQVAPPVVPTVFASTAAAWASLPDGLRERVAGLEAVHATGQARKGGYEDDDLLEAIRDREVSVQLPVGRAHPRMGRMMLYASQMNTREIVGLSAADSEALLEELFAHLYAPEAVWSHDWRNGDLVVWDNLAIQHSRPAVRREGPVRTLRKVIAPIPSLVGLTEVPRYAGQG